MSRMHFHLLCLTGLVLLLGAPRGFTRDQPQWGQAWSRNMVSDEKGLPDGFDPVTGRHIKWKVRIGTETHSTPVVADGRVYLGTNNGEPRDPKHVGDRGVLMCFNEKNGELLWQLVVPKREEDPYHDWPKAGISSPATVEGDKVYVVDNRGVVLCLDARGLANGNDGPFQDERMYLAPRSTNAPTVPVELGSLDADILWSCDLTLQAGIWSHDAAHSSILIHGDHLYLNSGTGVDNTHRKIRTPEAPSLVVLDKRTGRLLARDREGIAPNIFHCTWSSPSLGKVGGQDRIFFAGGNGIVYGFEPLPARFKPAESGSGGGGGELVSLKKVFQFDFDPEAPKTEVHRYTSNRRQSPSNIYGMPVFVDGKVFLAGGGDIFWGKNEAWLKCFDGTRTGDITSSGLLWSYPLEKHVLSTAALHEGLVYIADCGRKFHCVDAATGKAVWTHDIKGDAWGSPMVADGKVYFGTRAGQFLVFKAAREKTVLTSLDLQTPISCTPTIANGVVYFATMTHLYALQR